MPAKPAAGFRNRLQMPRCPAKRLRRMAAGVSAKVDGSESATEPMQTVVPGEKRRGEVQDSIVAVPASSDKAEADRRDCQGRKSAAHRSRPQSRGHARES